MFERLEPDKPRYRQSLQAQPDQYIEAIKRHLEQVLNTRQGCAQSAPGLGLQDFNGAPQGSGLALAISADIRRLIEAFEPRIKVIGVRYQPNPDLPLELNFHLDCHVRIDHRHDPVQIDVTLDNRNRYTRVT
nr:type VI secretion system baseplate subunit TssE [Pseudomonas gingeri]